jgi:nitrogen fixation NifU-like protein
MSMSSNLYQEVILEHNRKPRNYGDLPQATHRSEGVNPMCGDHLKLALQVEAGTIQSLAFTGESCAICKASASMMTQAVKGKGLAEAEALAEAFRGMITGQHDPEAPDSPLGRLKIFAGVAQLPSRVKCAVLGWHTLVAALQGQGQASTEGALDPIPGS